MEIKIRGVPPEVVAKLDRLAREKNQSREEFLRLLLRRFSDAPFLKDLSVNQVEVELLLMTRVEENIKIMKELEAWLNEQN